MVTSVFSTRALKTFGVSIPIYVMLVIKLRLRIARDSFICKLGHHCQVILPDIALSHNIRLTVSQLRVLKIVLRLDVHASSYAPSNVVARHPQRTVFRLAYSIVDSHHFDVWVHLLN